MGSLERFGERDLEKAETIVLEITGTSDIKLNDQRADRKISGVDSVHENADGKNQRLFILCDRLLFYILYPLHHFVGLNIAMIDHFIKCKKFQLKSTASGHGTSISRCLSKLYCEYYESKQIEWL